MAREQGYEMAEHEPVLSDPPTPEVERHVSDYSRFTALLKWGAIASFIVAMFVLFFLL